ncbi:ion channel [Comamonas sp. NLF-1-9]|uniref:ion channel n=1 Tax=Comamonas sp. NLF-1-9 TaxID=2853163 RepID=UPI001C437C60|nr:ion channel [Comamonas sp. NLF-1-9]QXL83172.1 NAD-binding protein [Comamonas sp. NLF-1-9]
MAGWQQRLLLVGGLQRLRIAAQRLHRLVRGPLWFPHLPLALALGLGGVWLLQVDLGARWQPFLQDLLAGQPQITPSLLPPLLIGSGMLTMALGLLLRSRVAWVMALLLAATAAVSMLFGTHRNGHLLLGYFVLLLVLLSAAWRQFDHASIAASTLFALTSVVMLVLYATFGNYYLGAQFKPPITDLVSALYFAMVTMTTVGYGDIAPATSEARLFTVSVIVLGVAVFATSLTAVIAPMVGNSLQRIVNRKGGRMKREHHFVVIGNTPLAVNTWRELVRRGQNVTRLLRQVPVEEPGEVDLVVGDPGSVEVLREAGAHQASAVMAMLDDDSENAFVVLAVRELGGSARTVAAVNDAAHLARVKLVQPDVVIAPQILGGELAAMLVCGEEVKADFVMQRVFQKSAAAPQGEGA